MRIAVIGTGYVGLVVGTALSEFGSTVVCVDSDEQKIRQLSRGECPIYEPGLKDLVVKNIRQGRLSFTTDGPGAIRESQVIFIAVGTPPMEDGSADLKAVLQVARMIGEHIEQYTVIVDKSTVPVGTAVRVEAAINQALRDRDVDLSFDVVSNPEFLREGSAMYEFMHPDRVVIGAASPSAREIMKEVYRVLYLGKVPFVFTSRETAELIKYATNSFLAVKISFINELSALCETLKADILEVSTALGLDGRIAGKFLHPGPGYGGSCFPKDTRALYRCAQEQGVRLQVIEAAMEANERQKQRMVERISSEMGLLEGRVITILGVTFKPGTDDMRNAPSLTILPELVRLGATLRVYDPQWEKEGPWRFESIIKSVTVCEDEYTASIGSDALVVLTEWNQFRSLDLRMIATYMRGRELFDLRNIFDPRAVRDLGFRYHGVGR